jgi:3-hydroxyacyl-[acyl-carrier-protein] dehydratase
LSQTKFDIRDIMGMLAHRYPFLLVDRVTEYEPDKSLTAIKNVTFNEPFFPGHFPGVPTMPGVLMLEAMAQACGLHACKDTGLGHDSGMILYFAGIDNARFKRPVVPGDQLILRVTMVKRRRSLWMYKATAHVGDELACAADLMCVLKDARKDAEG